MDNADTQLNYFINDDTDGSVVCVRACVYMFQVAGRLHVEVMRVAGGVADSMAGGEDGDSSPEGDPLERKLVCMVGSGFKGTL